MKRVFIALLCFSLALGLLACRGGKPAPSSVPTQPAPTGFQIPQPTTDPVLLARRQAVIDAMMEMATVRWTVPETVTYDQAGNACTLVAGRIYQGLPYTGAMGSYESFTNFISPEPDANGVYTLNATAEQLTGTKGSARVGNSCSTALQHAWAVVAPSIRSAGTVDMVPGMGYLSVGEYQRDETTNKNSSATTQDNGVLTMFAAYAHLQPGDAVVRYGSSSGHTMMVTDIHVELNAKGNISGEKSTVTFLHQTNGLFQKEVCFVDEATGLTVYPYYGVEDVRTFTDIYAEGYLPVTCKELVDPQADTELWVKDSEAQHTGENILAGTFTSNTFITAVRITLTSGGQTVQSATVYSQREHFHSTDLSRFTTEEPEKMLGSLDPAALAPGTYHCTHEVLLPTGQWIILRDFDFITE